jgi:hypothetical protein
MSRRISRILAVVIVAVLASMALSSAAVAVPTAVSAGLTGNATLVAKGAAVDVEFVYSCSSDATFADGRVDALTQRVSGGRIATGSGSSVNPLVCDGVQHTGAARVTASGSLAFKKGDALVIGSFLGCDIDFSCVTVQLSGTVRVH